MDGERTLTDGAMTVNLYAIEGNPHAGTFLVAYFPTERILVEADMFTPGAAGDALRAEPLREHPEAQPARRSRRPAARHGRAVRRTGEGGGRAGEHDELTVNGRAEGDRSG